MEYKILVLAVMALVFVYDLVIHSLKAKSATRPIPENVADIYDTQEYKTWLRYYGETGRLELYKHLISSLAAIALMAFNVYAWIDDQFFTIGHIKAAAVLVFADLLISQLWELPISYVRHMGIEQRYGFNRMTKAVFFSDAVKKLVVSGAISYCLVSIMVSLHQRLGDWLAPAFVAVGMGISLFVTFIAPLSIRLFNKLTPLEEGELRTKLMQLLEANGCRVRNIYGMNGSKRSTRANAFFAGLGKTKTIALYDTLWEIMTDDEIVAVFAHEMGHNKHKDTLKMGAINLVNFLIMGLGIWALVSVPEIYRAFGFRELHYGFAYILLGVFLGTLTPAMQLLRNQMSRKFEYAADRFAVENGYAQALISGLKKLTKANFGCLNPHPVLVKLYYSHPTTSQRIEKLFEK